MRLKANDILEALNSQEVIPQPLVVKTIDIKSSLVLDYELDAVIEFAIQNGPSFKAAVELLSISTPKMISQKAMKLGNLAPALKKQALVPMIIAPYISQQESGCLLQQGISWIDLSGNLLIRISPNIYIERTGKPNQYPDTSPIKNIYKGTSSLVGRALLLNSEGFSSLYEIVDYINSRNGTITLATVSKVLKSLEENLIVEKGKGKIRVKQPALLLENLAAGYAEYAKKQNYRQYPYDVENINELTTLFSKVQVDYAYCGFYAAKRKGLAMTDQITILVKSIQNVKKALALNPSLVRPDEEYGQVVFIETDNPGVWFNIQEKPLNTIVDDLELYLEMINDTPRGPKIANQLKNRILEKFNG